MRDSGSASRYSTQRRHFPAQRTHRLHCDRVHFGRHTAEHERRADDVALSQLTEHPSILRHTHLAADDECNPVGQRSVLDQTLAGSRRRPGPEADKLQDLARRQFRKREPADFLLLGRQPDRTTFEKEAPGLKEIESCEAEAARRWVPTAVWAGGRRYGSEISPEATANSRSHMMSRTLYATTSRMLAA